jgi:hypothetical protein
MNIRILTTIVFSLCIPLLHGCTDDARRAAGGGDDPDGDGYSNDDERRFAQLFHADPAMIEEEYTRAMADPEVPKLYLSLLPEAVGNPLGKLPSIEAIPRATVSVAVEGEGTMYPGSGDHQFALYRIHDDHTWSYNELEFKPVPAPGWRLDEDAWTPPRPSAFKLTLTPYLQDVVVAVFSEGVPEFSLTPTDAIARFVLEFAPGEDRLMFDRNATDIVLGEGRTKTVLVPNGLPDFAEAAVLQRVLLSPDFDRDKRPDYDYQTWRSTWLGNLAQAKKDVAKRADLPEWAADVIAVYTTMGPDRGAVDLLLRETFGIVIDWSDYETQLHRCLGPEGSVANSGGWPIDRWKQLTDGDSVSDAMIARFAELVVTE